MHTIILPYLIIATDCGEPINGTNADRQGSEHTYNHNVTYNCKVGYKVQSGDTVRICQENGSWSGASLNCSSKYYDFYLKIILLEIY